MKWQDWVFSVGQVIFLIALIPTLKGKDKPAFSTSIITGLVIALFALTYLSMKLWFSGIAGSAMSAAWLTLAYQKYRQLKK